MQKKLLILAITAALGTSVIQADTTLSGLIEVEAAHTDNDATKSSDISLATVELVIEHKLNDKVDAGVLLLYEEGENDDHIAVDEAVVNFHPTENFDLSVGRTYVPFGKFDTMMISDPQTLELAETQEDVALVAAKLNAFTALAYAFKDDEDGSGKIDDYGLSLDYESERFSAGVSYISDVNDKSDANNEASGVGVYVGASFGQLMLLAEHIQLETTAGGEKPKAINFELGFGFDFEGDKTMAASYQRTSDADLTGLPEEVMGLAYSMPVYKNTRFAAEYLHSEDYANVEDKTITLQVAYAF